MLNRMLGAIRLDVHTFEDVENDSGATLQAMLVVVIVSLAGGIGTFLAGEASLVWGIGGAIVRALLFWALWAWITYFVGTRLLKAAETHANWGQLARVTGFAQTPSVVGILVFIPFVGPIIAFAGGVWAFVAMVFGVRQALDYTSIWRALGVVAISFIIVLVILFVLLIIAVVTGLIDPSQWGNGQPAGEGDAG